MKNLVASAFALALFASPALSQSMRESYKGSQSERYFISPPNKFTGKRYMYSLNDNGIVHACGYDPSYSKCFKVFKNGKLNASYRREDYFYEFYIENGNLVKYECETEDYRTCTDSPTKEVLRPHRI